MTKRTLFILFGFLFCSVSGFAAELYTLETIKKVVSGDTFRLESGKTVRLIGVDAPENESNAKAKEDSQKTGQSLEDIVQRGKEAAEWVRVRLEGKKIFLKYDKEEKDRRGNEWVYAYLYDVESFYGGIIKRETFEDVKFEWWQVAERGAYIFINATIIRGGYATPVKDPPNLKYAELFEKAYREAQKEHEGLWDTDYFAQSCTEEGGRIGDCVGCVIRCCKGLRPMFNRIINGKCQKFPEPGSGGYCSHCGNKVCEPEYFEDHCNCPRDCS